MKKGYIKRKAPAISTREPTSYLRADLHTDMLAKELRAFIECYYDGMYGEDIKLAPDRYVRVSAPGLVCILRTVFRKLPTDGSMSVSTELTYETFTVSLDFDTGILDAATSKELSRYAEFSGFILVYRTDGIDIKTRTCLPDIYVLRSTGTDLIRAALSDYFFDPKSLFDFYYESNKRELNK